MFSKFFGLACIAAIATAKRSKSSKSCGAFGDCSNTLYTLGRELNTCKDAKYDLYDQVYSNVSLLRDEYEARTGMSISTSDFKAMLYAEFDAQYLQPGPTPVLWQVDPLDTDCIGTESPVSGAVDDWRACLDMSRDTQAFIDWLDDKAFPTRYGFSKIESDDGTISGSVFLK
jgi:superoxide dismutase, Cu-Zn family